MVQVRVTTKGIPLRATVNKLIKSAIHFPDHSLRGSPNGPFNELAPSYSIEPRCARDELVRLRR
jgi:hypothetical protein